MPFYEYECSNCKFYVEVLQKISDEPLKKCPSCKKQALKKLVSAPVFRLKGGGWYETDFKSDQEEKRNLVGEEKEPEAKADDSKADDPKKDKAEAKPEAKAETKAEPQSSKSKSSKPAAKKPAVKAKPLAKSKPVPKSRPKAKPAKKKSRR